MLVKWVGVEHSLSTWEWLGDPRLRSAPEAAEAQGVPAEAPWGSLWLQYAAALECVPSEAVLRTATAHAAAAAQGRVFDRSLVDAVAPCALTRPPLVPCGKRLFPHQMAGVSFLLSRRAAGLSCVLADDMGAWGLAGRRVGILHHMRSRAPRRALAQASARPPKRLCSWQPSLRAAMASRRCPPGLLPLRLPLRRLAEAAAAPPPLLVRLPPPQARALGRLLSRGAVRRCLPRAPS